MELFFLSCIVPNWFFTFWTMFFKYFMMIFIFIKTIFLHDALFYYANKGRYAVKNKFSKLWKFTAFFFGFIFFGLGLALFIYSFIVYDPVCLDYIAINVTMISLASVHLVISFIKYRFHPEFTSSLVFFFVIAIFNYGIITATPYTKCISSANMSFLQNKFTTNLDAAVNFIFLLIVCIFLSRESMTGINLTLSKYSRKIYDGIILDFEEKDRVVYLEEVEKSRFKNEKNIKQKVKRNKKDVGFHFFMMAAGAYISMLYTSWTTIWEHEFSIEDIADYSTIWVRFSATVAGIFFCIVVSGLNLKNINTY